MNTHLFIDISSDYIYLSYGDAEKFLARNGIEHILGPELIKREKKYGFTDVFVLNGPGGFTNLRIGTLCLNLLNVLLGGKLNFWSVSKTELYQYGIGKYGADGRRYKYGVIYIGQKRNIWLWDFTYSNIITTRENHNLIIENGSDDRVKNPQIEQKKQMNREELQMAIALLEDKQDVSLQIIRDIVYETDYYPDFLSDCSMMRYDEIKKRFIEYVKNADLTPIKELKANYLIDPIITPPRCKN